MKHHSVLAASLTPASRPFRARGSQSQAWLPRPRWHCLTWGWLSMLVLGLSGCGLMGPDYRPALPWVPAAWSRAATATQAPQTAASAPSEETARHPALAAWWTHLGDPLLVELVDQALAGSADLAAARARLRQARARRALAGAEFYPTVTATGAASRAGSSEQAGAGATGNLFSAGFDASWEPDLFGATRRGAEAAQADLEATQASLDASRVSLAAEVAVNYVELRAYQGRLAIARANAASQAETLRLTDWRAQAGLVTALDVAQASTQLDQTRAGIPTLETSLAEAKNRLAILTGQPPGSLEERLSGSGSIPAVPDGVLTGIPVDALRQRPDVRAAERTLAAETARIGVAEAQRYPNLGLSGYLGLESLTLGGLTGGNALAGSLLASLTGTLFDGGRLQLGVEIQHAVQAQALAAYESAVLTALEDVENALAALDNGRRRGQTLGRAAQSAAAAEQLARQQYAAGLVDFETVLTTQRTLLTVQDHLKSSESDTATALIQLYKALGGGWGDEPRDTGPQP